MKNLFDSIFKKIKKLPVEAEGGELILKNSYGQIAIIPKKDRKLIQKYLKEGCHTCIDEYVSKLPKVTDYGL